MKTSELVERLRGWVTDWDGSPMVRGEPPRDGIHCDILIDAADALTAQAAMLEEMRSGAIGDVAAERRRQVESEGWTPEHDDTHVNGQMALAAACYATERLEYPDGSSDLPPPTDWQWADEWWKPSTHRRNLVKAGALIVAEIERLDRASNKAGGDR